MKRKKTDHEKEVLLNNNIQLKHLYLSIKAENRELKKRIYFLTKQVEKMKKNKSNGGFLNTPISDETKKAVQMLYEQGLSYRKIAKRVGISAGSVCNIVKNKRGNIV